MARLLIKTYKNNNDKSAAYGKTYGRLVHQDTMNTTDLCRHMMKHGTIFTSDVVNCLPGDRNLFLVTYIGYYFKDGSNTPTIYQDHPLNFNLSFGLRFNLK